MAWSKHFTVVPTDRRLKAQLRRQQADYAIPSSGGTGNKFASYLPEVYAGHPLRIERYSQYDQMDSDSEINAALDTIADFSTQRDSKSNDHFKINYLQPASDSEVESLKLCLQKWVKLNEFKKRLWRMFRSTMKYGDQFFVRDPETFKWYWLDPAKVEKVLVNEADGKAPEAYIVRDLDLNLQSLTATLPDKFGNNTQGITNTSMQQRAPTGGNPQWSGSVTGSTSSRQSRFDTGQNLTAIDAEHIVHLSLSEGLDANWPFGTSILESVFKVYRQKEMLEEAILIYRIQRAPERRVYYVDVGNMPPHKAGAYLERVKNEIHQRRFPSRNGGGMSTVDAAYNPMSMMEDMFFAQTADGRGSKVDTLPGGENLGQIDDLKYFDNKLKRGLRIPSTYLPSGPEDGGHTYTDGRVGTAYIQEFRFAEYCQRLQNLLSDTFDYEFKLFVKNSGVEIDVGLYELELNEPENFGTYAKIELDSALISVYQPLTEHKHFSKRWLMREKLGMTEDEIIENQKEWRQENKRAVKVSSKGNSAPAAGDVPGLEGVGIRPNDDDSFMGDEEGGAMSGAMDNIDNMGMGSDGSESAISGYENQGSDTNPL